MAQTAPSQKDASPVPRSTAYKRIATEEAWVTREIADKYAELIAANPADEQGFMSMGRFIYKRDGNSPVVRKLLDMDAERIADMDALGIDVQLLLLTAPGVQVFDADTATGLARDSNDQLEEAIRNHPDRFAGLAAVAPQDPKRAAVEIERGMTKLGLNGVVINSHTKGEYLDDPKFWEIFEAAEAHNAPIYIHPRTPANGMLEPYLKRGLEMAIMGFGAEVALHTLAIITNGVFDRFPRLQIVIGHAGEGLPYLLYRIDHMQKYVREAARGAKKLNKLPSDYMRENITITTSGVAWEPAITFAQKVLGVDRVIYAMDYPYQALAREVIATDNLPISAADKKKLYQTNSEKLFNLKTIHA